MNAPRLLGRRASFSRLFLAALTLALGGCGSCAGDDTQHQQQAPMPIVTHSSPRMIRAPLGALNIGDAAPAASSAAPAPSAP